MHAQVLHLGPIGTYCMVHNNFSRTKQKKLRGLDDGKNEAVLINIRNKKKHILVTEGQEERTEINV